MAPAFRFLFELTHGNSIAAGRRTVLSTQWIPGEAEGGIGVIAQPNAKADDFAGEPVAAAAIRLGFFREGSPTPAQVDNTVGGVRTTTTSIRAVPRSGPHMALPSGRNLEIADIKLAGFGSCLP